ncbi:MAG: hypothetical protein WD751_04435 [Anaerolineales bacterium]
MTGKSKFTETGSWAVWAPLAIIGVVLFITLGGLVVQALWNWLLPMLFGWPQVTFWQALGVLVLSRILFGGIGMGGGRGRHKARRSMADRLEHMTPEEREELRQRLETAYPQEKESARPRRSKPRTTRK